MGRIGMAVATLAFGACFSKPGFTPGGDDAPPIDAPVTDAVVDAAIDGSVDAPIDAPGSCTGATTMCSANTLETCNGAGAAPVLTACSFGCTATPTAHCRQYTPTGGSVNAADLAPDPALAAITLNAAQINARTGEISGVRAAGNGLISGIRFDLRASVGVFRFKSLTVAGTLALIDTNAIALVANGDITINAVVDGTTTCATSNRTAGGSPGGAAATSSTGPGGGLGGTAVDEGGSGGGHGTVGGNGGYNSGGGRLGGATFITSMIVGGGGGGGGYNGGGAGGSGGAAIQIASNGTVAINTGGGINAGGCGGRNTTANSPGGGGGAGGLILIEAFAVDVAGTLAVNGGGGSACEALGTAGTNGMLARTIAPGGMATGSTGHGGGGGFGVPNNAATLAGQNPPMLATHGGGGGGGIGRIIIKTSNGIVSVTGTMSPAYGDTGTTAVNATLVAQ